MRRTRQYPEAIRCRQDGVKIVSTRAPANWLFASRMLPAVFTGIVQHLGTVESVDSTDFGRRICVNLAGWQHNPSLGESIAVNGCCLTIAAQVEEHRARFDVIEQTLRVTALGGLKCGDRVNLEHSVTPGTLLGGHIVQGHIDAAGCVQEIRRGASESESGTGAGEYRIRIDPGTSEAMGMIVDRGSIAVNGVSLTIAAVSQAEERWFEVALIPTTLLLTNLGTLTVGEGVNLEFDYIAKIVAHWLSRRDGSKPRQ